MNDAPSDAPAVQVYVPEAPESRFSEQTQKALSTLTYELLHFSNRLGYILNVQGALELAIRGKSFLVYHEPMWRMLLGERDMIIVDLDSWIEALHGSGGFLKSLSHEDRRALGLEWERTDTRGTGDAFLEAHVAGANRAWREEAFRRLFPKATSEPSEEDLRALGKRVYDDFEPVRRDRNQHRAHKYDKAMPKTAAMLSPVEVVKHHEACRQLLADLRCLSVNSQWISHGYHIKLDAKDDEARDLVDLILFGDIGWVHNYGFLKVHEPADDFYWKKREAFLERLHAAHDAAGDGAAPFNNRALVFDDRGSLKQATGGAP
jgi:hypothetical protein